MAHGIQRVSHNSLTIFNEMANSTAPTSTSSSLAAAGHMSSHADVEDDDNEPGYERLPDHRRQHDPGYETLHAATLPQLHRNPSTSDYDPNYEVLRHNKNHNHNNNNNNNEDDDSTVGEVYAKVWQTAGGGASARIVSHIDSENQLNDGYSSIKAPTADPSSGPKATGASTKPPHYHDYAQIGLPPRTFQLAAAVAADLAAAAAADDASAELSSSSDLYSSIATVVEQQHGTADPNYSTIPEATASAAASALLHPSSKRSSVASLSIATANVTPTTASTTPSGSSSASAAVTPIEYTSMHNSSTGTISSRTSATLTNYGATNTPSTPDVGEADIPQHPHTYDSLTGSESDPNYESVRYGAARPNVPENPYERLYSPATATTTTTTAKIVPAAPSDAAAAVVDDYFHV